MLRFEAGADDLLRSRFAISPLFELDNLLRKLSGLSPYRLPGAWSARLAPVYRRLRATTDLDAVLALHSRTRGPGFAAPPPRSLAQSIGDDLATVRATALPDARREIDRCLNLRPARDERVWPSCVATMSWSGSPAPCRPPGTSCSQLTGRSCVPSANAMWCTGPAS
jgi:hypothetical protein